MSFKYSAQKIAESHYVLPKIGGMKVEAHAFLSDSLYEASEEALWKQLSNGASYEGVIGAYAMPDTHSGYGVPVGCVIVTEDTVIQAASGYDISCGVLYMKVPLTAGSVKSWYNRERWVREVEKRVATGVGSARPKLMPKFSEKKAEEILRYGAKALGISGDLCERQYIPVPEDIDLNKINRARSKVVPQLGSVGGGNHFIEMQVDRDSGEVYVMVHCGSRGYGWQTAEHFFYEGAKARGLSSKRREESWVRVDEPVGRDYWAHHNSAANFAIANRHIIVQGIQEALQEVFNCEGEVYYEISHNLVQEETLVLPDGTTKKGFVHRKGATRAFPAGHPDLVGTIWEKTGHPCLIPGCLGQGTRILMANGFYRDIETVNVGDTVISGGGKPAQVVATYDRGKKPTVHYRSNQFWSVTDVTPDHKHLIGDISGDRASLRRTDTRTDILSRKNRSGESKVRWCPIAETPHDFALLAPRKIEFALAEPSTLEIADQSVQPSYDLGYIFGTYLGDGSSQRTEKPGHNWRGQANWYFGPNESEIAEKLIGSIWRCFALNPRCYKTKVIQVTVHSPSLAKFFHSFGKKTNKHLPEAFFIGDTAYLRGMFDGMVDSDGHTGGGTKKFTNTSTRCVELFGVVHHILFGYFPSVSVRAPNTGGLRNCKLKNCNTSYRASALKKPPLIQHYQLVDPIGFIHTNKRRDAKKFQRNLSIREVPTYDLTLSGDDPSFIANNVIVHNSMYHGAAILFAEPGAHKSACSVNHGSGRKMARGEAKRKLEHKQLRIDEEMKTVQRTFDGVTIEGIVGNTKQTPLDECGHVYKDLDEVLGVLETTGIARVAHRMYPVANIKGTD